MEKEMDTEWVLVVPRAIIGIAILFWGIMVEQELLAVALAILLESHYFVSIRWNFSFSNYVKAWHLSVIFFLFGGFLYWMDGYKLSEMRVMFEWLPVVFSPLMFVQNFGEQDCMPLNTFSLIARRRMKADIREGRVVDPMMVNFGTPYLGMVLLSAGLVKRSANFWDIFSINVMVFYTGILVLIAGAFLYLVGRRAGRGFISFVLPYSLIVFFGLQILNGLTNLELKFRGGASAQGSMEMEQSITRIGKLGELKLSKKIHWRMWVPEGEKVPRLVPMAVYDNYVNGTWMVSDLSSRGRKDLYSRGVTAKDNDDITYFDKKYESELVKMSPDQAIRFVSTIETNKSQALIPHLYKTIGYSGLVGKEAFLEKNRLGAVRIVNLDATLQALVYRKKEKSVYNSYANRSRDLAIPLLEQHSLEKIISEQNLKGASPREKISRLKRMFHQDFRYTTHLDVTALNDYRTGYKISALSNFLREAKAGHCEYFATATTLLLRQAGIPARYVTGYSVGPEMAEDAYVMRGNQAHAWSQAWIDNQWVDVDLTPPDWFSKDSFGELSWQTKMSDFWKTWREDFQVWRNSPENSDKVDMAVFVVLGALVVWIFIRLWFAKNKKAKGKEAEYQMPPGKIMKRFDRWCTKLIGARHHSVPYGEWVLQLEEQFPDDKTLILEFVRSYRWARFSGVDTEYEKLERVAVTLMKKEKV